MQLKTRLVRPGARRQACVSSDGWVQARSVQVRLRVRTQLGNRNRLATGELLDEIPGLTSREQASLKDALCLLAKLGQTVTGKDLGTLVSDGLCTLSEGAAGAPAGRSSVSRCQAADVDSEQPL
jgi:hypothetical protein